MAEVTVVCSRCRALIDGHEDATSTSNFYRVAPDSYWYRYSRPGEEVLCDDCMHKDRRYKKDFTKAEILLQGIFGKRKAGKWRSDRPQLKSN
jgi:hypothetical protein